MCQPLVNKRRISSYLAESSGLGVRPSIGEWILVVVKSVAISSDDNNTENFRQEHLRSSVVNYFLRTEVGGKRRRGGLGGCLVALHLF